MVKQLLTAGALVFGLGLAGCVLVVDDKNRRNNGGGGGDSGGASASVEVDDGSSGTDDGASSSSSGGTTTTSSSSSSSSQGGGQQRFYVYGYRDAYRNLPEMGETKDYFRAHGELAQVDRGYYYGDWHCGPNGMIKEGAGHGETVIDGHLEIKGNNWVLRNITVTGDVKIRGNDNDLTGLQVLGGPPDVRGTGNKLPR